MGEEGKCTINCLDKYDKRNPSKRLLYIIYLKINGK